MTVLLATGDELEQQYAFGVVRQLLEPALRALDAGARDEVLSGAAALAAPVVAGAPGDGEGDVFAVMHGLYWLVVNLTERSPLLLVVDDLHLADAASLRFLGFLERRLDGVAATLVLAVRSGEPSADDELLDRLAGGRTLRVPALSEKAVATLVEEALGPPDPAFVTACAQATGAVPVLLRALLGELVDAGVKPTAAAAGDVPSFGSASLGHATIARVRRLSGGAPALARAVAVLGADARLQHAASLADLDAAAADALVAAGVLGPTRPLRFVHAILRSAVYQDIGPAARAAMHAEAARLLAAQGADADAIASHLLLTEPAVDPEVIDRLRVAARLASGRGSPEVAHTHLSRALEEGAGPELRGTLLEELAAAERAMLLPDCFGHFYEAMELAGEPSVRDRRAYELAQLAYYGGLWDWIIEFLDTEVERLGDADPALAIRMRGLWATTAGMHPHHVLAFEARAEELAAAARGTRDGRGLLLLLAARAAFGGADPSAVVAMVDEGLDDGRLLADDGPDSLYLSYGVTALVGADDLARASALTASWLAEARRRGSFLGTAVADMHEAWVRARGGDLVGAEGALRSTLGLLSDRPHLAFLRPLALCYAHDVLLERNDADDLLAGVDELAVPDAFAGSVGEAWVLELRARLSLLRGDRETAAGRRRGFRTRRSRRRCSSRATRSRPT